MSITCMATKVLRKFFSPLVLLNLDKIMSGENETSNIKQKIPEKRGKINQRACVEKKSLREIMRDVSI